MKKCIVFTGIFPPDIGGPATYVPKLVKHLTLRGWEAHVVCLADQEAKVSLDESAEVTRLSRGVHKILRIPIILSKIRNKIRESDVIFATGMHEEAALIAVLFKKRLVCKVVGNPVWEQLGNKNSEPTNNEIKDFNVRALSIFQKLRLKFWLYSLSISEVVTTPSQELKNHLQRLSIPNTIQVIENGTEIYPLIGQKDEEIDVVTISRLVKWKNIDILINASKHFQFSLCIIGNGPEMEKLKQLADNSPNIRFTGALNSTKSREYLAKSKVFCLISSYEGLSFSLLEAFSLGRACVLSDIQGNRSATKNIECVEFVPLRDVEATGSAIQRLLKDVEYRKVLGMKSHDLAVKYYDSENRLSEVEKLLSGTYE